MDTEISIPTKQEKNDECHELRNIKYKSMLINGSPINEPVPVMDNLQSLNTFLENEKKNINTEPWSKLHKSKKIEKITTYIINYSKTHNLTELEVGMLTQFLKESLDKKKLTKVKDVLYNKNTGEITSIPGLIYNNTHKKYTIKNLDKRISTSKSLPPKKTSQKTIKNKVKSIKPIIVDDIINN